MIINKLIPPEKESDIQKYWIHHDKIYISCICTTYNQDKYIEDTLNGMLAQKCDFKFEIIVHDDLSTDNTREILFKYKEKYPSIIKLILQNENQYQKKKKIFPLAIEQASGDFIALCEGDDFWINENKLNLQINILKKHQNINLCVHNAISYNCVRNKITNLFKFQVKKDSLINPYHIYATQGQFSATASMFFRRIPFKIVASEADSFPVLDFFIEAILGNNGVYYLKNSMCCYRYGSNGSWSIRELNNLKKSIIRNKNMLLSLEKLNYLLEYKQLEIINIKKSHISINLILLYPKIITFT
ncbi:glycosyltransferase family 2 protein [Proteus mirabilis]|uniref:glycosyltransferase family 2 protein n=1 Tax=Proteus mirabilis TaxID=584 RepID=UPI001E4E1B2D|nr:glycosyltransferase family 2 protein [Proteus mirabilis]MCD4595634.1 glycosyltransferase family 2 protein [Proteus mirabilis]